MKRGNHSKSRGSKALVMILAVVLLVGASIGGTIAWLTDKTDPVVNTFTVGDVDIDLTEAEATNNVGTFQMIPGYTITKSPKVTVLADSEKCWLFVKVDESANFDSFMTYVEDTGWNKLEESATSTVYYREVADTNADQPFVVLKDNQVKVKDTVTKAMMDALTTETYPTLTFTAYACQYMKNNTEAFTAAQAWDNVKPATP